MSRKNDKENASCIICGNKYYLCIACERNKTTWKPWKIITDTEKCFKIYDILNKYNFNKISKEEAKEKLNSLNLGDLNIFKDSVREQIEEINGIINSVETIEISDTVTTDIIEEVSVDETVDEINIEVADKKFKKRTSKKTEE